MTSSLLRLVIILVLVTPVVGVAQEAPATSNSAERIARRIEKQVSDLRGLRFVSPTKIGVYSRDELRARVEKEMASEMPAAKLEGYRRAMVKLGLIAPDLNLGKLMIDLLEEQIGGFYDPESKELYLIRVAEDDEKGRKLNDVIMSHELVHALQDQHFDLAKKLGATDDDEDRMTAYKSVVEGDATLAMMLFEAPGGSTEQIGVGLRMLPVRTKAFVKLMQMAKRMGVDDMGGSGLPVGMDTLAKTPAVVADGLLFSYLGGARFCWALHEEAGGMKGIDKALASPPLSTEQILHPEKYWKTPDWPTKVMLPALDDLLDGYTVIHEDTLGELHVGTWLMEGGIESPDKVHSGWDGDRYALYAVDDEPDVLVASSVWDTEADAREFYAASVAILARRHADRRIEVQNEGTMVFANRRLASALRLDGRRVSWVEDAPRRDLDDVMERLATEVKLHDMTPSKSDAKSSGKAGK